MRGYLSDGMTTTVFPTAIAGNTRDKNPSKGASEGQMIATVPTGSCIASETFRNGGLCTAAIIFVRPGRVREDPFGAAPHLGFCLLPANDRSQATGDFLRALIKVLGNVVQHLRPTMRCRSSPICRLASGFNGVPVSCFTGHRMWGSENLPPGFSRNLMWFGLQGGGAKDHFERKNEMS